MAVANRKEFTACVTKSKAIPAEKLNEWLDSVDEEDPKKIAAKLIQDELLTPWQAKFLLSGRSRVSVGNYVLQSRISRDELGDKFEALHTQLNRRVVIQVFPSSVSKNESLLNKLLAKLRSITELDHPNLVHVYDVDQENDRYFLVTEYVEGNSLDTISPKDLSISEIAVIIQGIGSGLAYSHQNEIVHGNISPENIIVKPNGDAKLEGFPSATLKRETNSDAKQPTAGSDLRRLSKIGSAFLKKTPEESRSERYDDIKKMITGLRDPEQADASLASLGDWVSANIAVAESSSNLELEPADDSFLESASSADAGNFDSPMSTVAATTLKKKTTSAETPETESESSNFLKRMWEEKRAAFITCAAAIFLFFAGGLVTLGIVIGGGSGSEPAQSLVATKNVKADAPKNVKADASKSRKVAKEALDPEANRKKLEKMFQQRKAKRAEAKKAKAAKAKAEKAKDEKAKADEAKASEKAEQDAAKPAPQTKDAPTSDEADAAAKDAEGAGPDSKDKPSADKKTPNKPAPAKKKAPPKASKKPPAKIGNPFEKFVKATQLPPPSDTNDFKIADLVIEKNHLLGLKLVSEQAIARSKVEFDLNRSDNDKQLWNVELKLKRSAPIPVAQFQKTPTEMKFRWLPAAAEDKNAGYLRNCMLELSTPKDSVWLGLRTPTDLNEFAFADDSTSAKLEVEIPWLPNPDAIKVELQPFQIGTRADQVGFEPREFTDKFPGRIFFRDKQPERFFFVDVSADLRKKTKLQAQMMVLLPNGKPQPIRSMDDLAKFSNSLGTQSAAATYRFEQLDAAERPKSMTGRDFGAMKKEASDNAKQLTSAYELSQRYVELSKQLSGRVIPLQIYFEMENHRIILAEAKASKK